ncbi:HEPN domain-containing protein [Azospirillum brasilense]|uniref:HEPN domain-containing protein n=1 Tax=Azospirillum argentinense TaxID=2970906 RepID=UPI00190EB2F2|nr:HEPN domain-containing protein [Azospirillum argentinense]MBK3801401.1 HEPN domain-containing protein [Azospirillum argentinense]
MNRAKAESYIALAEEDLLVAKKLMTGHPRHSAFNIEQAAEKLLKAVLTVENIAFSTQHHQLGMLAELLPSDHVWRADLMAFDTFTPYATKVRYPTPGGDMPSDPVEDELESGWKDVSLLVGEIRDWCDEQFDRQAKKRR